MEYLLDIDQLDSAAEVLAEGETVERLIEQIEELRALFHAKRFGKDLEEEHTNDLIRKAICYQLWSQAPTRKSPKKSDKELLVSLPPYLSIYGP